MGKTRKKYPPLCHSCWLQGRCQDPCHPSFCEYHPYFKHAKRYYLYQLQLLYESPIAGAFLYDQEVPLQRSDLAAMRQSLSPLLFSKPHKPRMNVKSP
jgi:hypothetical protein